MSTIVQMPVRVKPPPADTGDTVSPGCASFEIATPLNGARMIVSSRFVLCQRHLLLRHPHLLLRGENARVERVDLRLRGLDFGLGGQAAGDEPLQPRERQLRFVQAHFVLADAAPGRCRLRFGQRQRRPQRRVVEPREHLALPDRHAFLDVHFDELAGDLGRDGRAAPRGDVAGGVEDRGLRAGRALRDGRRLDLDRTFARDPPPGRRAGGARR